MLRTESHRALCDSVALAKMVMKKKRRSLSYRVKNRKKLAIDPRVLQNLTTGFNLV